MIKSKDHIQKITIIGMGLIGGSLGLALKNSSFKGCIYGVDKENIIKKALNKAAIDKGSSVYPIAVENADIIIVATPVKKIPIVLHKIRPFLSKGMLVTDTGSTKKDIMIRAKTILPDDVIFIGGHPMAGSEKNGIDFAKDYLFKSMPYLVISENCNDMLSLGKMSQLIHWIGAYEILLNAQQHDKIVAIISHIPQLLAILLTNMLGQAVLEEGNEKLYQVTGNAFNDITRLASSPFGMWKDIYQSNQNFSVQIIDQLIVALEKSRNMIRKNPADLKADFDTARLIRENLLSIKNYNIREK